MTNIIFTWVKHTDTLARDQSRYCLCAYLNYYAIDGNIFHFSVQTKLNAET